MKSKGILYVLLLLMLVSCGQKRSADTMETPWGNDAESIAPTDFDLSYIQASGELIMLTMTGPNSYYDYHGRELGTQYLLCCRFAKEIGVRVRVDVCKDTLDMLQKLQNGEGDIVAYPVIRNTDNENLIFCGIRADSLSLKWAVSKDKPLLASAIDKWYKPSILGSVKEEENYFLSNRSIKRQVYAPMMNKSKGVISKYDALFVKYSRRIGWDWRLMAAQCYQESTFDPKAKSWAGACGLMQIMPSTAEKLDLPMSKIFHPESNIAAAAKYLAQLEGRFKDIPSRHERINFVLASYNGGINHIRDAMSLARHYGKNCKRWRDVEPYVLMLATPQGYNHPVVTSGYMRGTETVDYVAKIRKRWNSYRGAKTVSGIGNMVPQRAKNGKNKYEI